MNLFKIFQKWSGTQPKQKQVYVLSFYQNLKKLELLQARFEAKKKGNK